MELSLHVVIKQQSLKISKRLKTCKKFKIKETNWPRNSFCKPLHLYLKEEYPEF